MRKSCSLPWHPQPDLIVRKKADLIDELMTAASDDIIRELVDADMPYDMYYTYSVIIRLQAPEKLRDSYVQRTRSIIEKVAGLYTIPVDMLIDYICRKSATYMRRDPELVALLHEHIPQSSEEKAPAFEEFLSKIGHRDLWGREEMKSFSVLFDQYSKKVQIGDLTRRTVSLSFEINLYSSRFRKKSTLSISVFVFLEKEAC
jgi:hypothetical protein